MKDYVKSIRKYIGNSPLLLVGVGAIIVQNGKMLLQKRADNHKWAIHGGALELGESIEETLIRELKEELGITPVKYELFKVFSGEKMHCFYSNSDEVYMVNHIFICHDFEGAFNLQKDEVKELSWFDLNDLPENINEPVDQTIIEAFLESAAKLNYI